ncbi:MAG: AAA family ATPase [Chloroflexi bacterium]|nr:AAA family ATPase [Chloroflexota bacterium]
MQTQILLLGPPEVRQDGHPHPITRRILRSLLFYLASQGGMVGREELLTLFWEEEDDLNARRRLSDTLSRLRYSLPDPDALLVDSSLVGLDFKRVYVDQIEFEELVNRAGRVPWQIPPAEPLPEAVAHTLHQSILLWRSPKFLAGAKLSVSTGLDAWLTRATQHLEHTQVRVLGRLSEHYQATGDLEQALHLVRLALTNDELNEELNYRLLRLLIDLGLSHDARRQFENYQKLMRRELDTSPSARFVELYRQIRSAGKARPAADAPPDWKLRPSMQAPFVGRRNLLDQLQRIYHKGGGAFIFGESGQGKTRLMQEFTGRIAPAPRVLLATCRPAESNLPFQPIIELLRNHVLPEEWLALSPVWAVQLTLLIPDLKSIRSDLEHPPADHNQEIAPGQARAQLLEAIRQIFLHIARDRRLIFCLDDAQWSDESTLATISYLLERPPFDQRAFLLVAARGDETTPYLEQLLTNLQQNNKVSVVPVVRLSDNEITELTQQVTGFALPDPLSRQLSNETGGNPFFLLESLRSLLERQPQADFSRLTSLPLVESIQGLITARLSKLPRHSRSALEVAAVMGADFTPEFVAEVMQESPFEVANALEDLTRRALIEPVDETAGTAGYHFVHDKIKEVILQKLSPFRARLLHRRVAQALEAKSPGDDQAAVLAQHYEQANDPSRALECWVRAIRRARQLIAFADALWICARAERLVARSSQLTDLQIHYLYMEWTEMAYELDDVVTIQHINTNLLKLGRERNSPLLIGSALDGFSDACMASNQFEEGLAYCDQALPYLELGNSISKLMQAYNHRGVFLYMLNRLGDAIDNFQDGLALGCASADPQVLSARANAHYQIAIARIFNGWPEIGKAHAARSLSDYTTVNGVHGRITAYSALALSGYFLGEYIPALENCKVGIELAQRGQAQRMLGYLHIYSGMLELGLGNLDAAREHSECAISIGEQYRHLEIAGSGHRVLGDMYYWLGAHELSLEPYQRAYELTRGTFLHFDAQIRLGSALLTTGKPDQGRQMIEEAIAAAESVGLGAAWLVGKHLLAMLLMQSHNWRPVVPMIRDLFEDAQKRAMPTIRLGASLLLGDVALREGKFTAALGRYQEAAAEASQMRHPWMETYALRRLLLSERMNATEASAIHQRLIEIIAHVRTRGDHPAIAQACQAFRSRILTSPQ